ncbi:MAG TPA: aspartyl protease family protein [Steroidobacteraceae bacterium]|nr:aspartyl protease family protein [Steroidobacteraceae bacterium]
MSASLEPAAKILRTVLPAAAGLLFLASAGAQARSTVARPAARADIDPRVASLIERSGSALHVAALRSIRVIHATGDIVANGLRGRGDNWNEMGAMRQADRFSTPPLGGGSGWDGKESWSLDQTGLVVVDGSELGRSSAVNQAYFSNYDLWTPNRGGAAVVWGGSRSRGGNTYDVLTVMPPTSSLPVEVWFDRATDLPVRMVQRAGPVVTTLTLADFKPVDGLMIPYRVTNTGDDGAFTATRVEANPPDGAAHLVAPKSSPRDFSIAGGAKLTSVPIRVVENHVYVEVRLDGRGPFRFELDTGGANVIDPAVAEDLGLARRGSTQVTGVGGASPASSFALVKTLQIGSARLTNQVFVVFPIARTVGMAHGIPMDGVVGYEVLSRFITTFDYGNGRIVLRMPGSYAPPADAAVVPIALYGTQPQFACGIDGVPTTCTLDTGATQSLQLFMPFIAAHPGVVPARLTAPGVSGFGVGGATIGRLGRVQTLSLGGLTLHDLIAEYPTRGEGAFAMPFIGANVGGAVWKRFTVTLDYHPLTMTLIPDAQFHAPDHWDRSGVYLIDNGAITILGVRPGTPAARAGLAPGDVITAVDGSSTLSLRRVRAAFRGEPGTVVHVLVKSKHGAAHAVDVTLAGYI